MTMTPEELAMVLADVGGVMQLPTVRPDQIRKVVEIELGSGALHVEVYAAVGWTLVLGEAGGDGASAFVLARTAAGTWSFVTGSGLPLAPGEGVDAAIERLEEQTAWFRPKPIAAPPARPRKARVPLPESEGAGMLAETPTVGDPPRASDDDVDAAERALGTRLPAGYRTFVVALGEGVYGTKLRVYPPSRVVGDLTKWRDRIERFWFWGDAPLPHAIALECIVIADTMDGDEIVFHPSDPDTLFLLPRDSERARSLGRGLARAITKVVRAGRPVLEAFSGPEC